MTVGEQLDQQIAAVVGEQALHGFQRAYMLAEATKSIKGMLTPEYMAPIMELQGSKLGFRTDKDQSGGYPEPVVKQCLIEAVLNGMQPVGNQFNIIGGNMYPTKEGLGYLLDNWPGLRYDIVPGLPRIGGNETSAAVDMTVRWSLHGGESQERVLPIAVRVNRGMGVDAVIGKATRKARHWLHATISGTELGEAEVSELEPRVEAAANAEDPTEEQQTEIDADTQYKRVEKFVHDAKSTVELDYLQDEMKNNGIDVTKETRYRALFDHKRSVLLRKEGQNG